MSLRLGTVIGVYKVTAKIGEGGMGEVYEALDTELDRKVALKVLPDDVADNPERLQRFRREAKALAALNHPNIVTIHGVEESNGRRFLIMERIEGESIDRLLPAGGLPLDKVFDIAIQIADALAAAHAKARGDVAAALARLDESRPTLWFQQAVASPFYAQAFERYMRAELLAALGREREAAGWFKSLVERTPFELIYQSVVEKRLGELPANVLSED